MADTPQSREGEFCYFVRLPCTGTAAYMAPELLQKGKMTRAADVYSFAMIMVELFTCKRLFEGLAQQQVRSCHLLAHTYLDDLLRR